MLTAYRGGILSEADPQVRFGTRTRPFRDGSLGMTEDKASGLRTGFVLGALIGGAIGVAFGHWAAEATTKQF